MKPLTMYLVLYNLSCMIGWGACSAATSLVGGETSLLALRFALGLAEEGKQGAAPPASSTDKATWTARAVPILSEAQRGPPMMTARPFRSSSGKA